MKLQEITHDFEIINKTKIGKEIQSFSQSMEVYLENEANCNFMNGGCYLFARVMKEKLKKYNPTYSSVGRKVIVENGVEVAEVIDHVILKINFEQDVFYIDSQGIATGDEMIEKMVICEGVIESVIVDNIEEDEINTKINSYEGSNTEKRMFMNLKNHVFKFSKPSIKNKLRLDVKM